MAVPKRKMSKARRDSRRANWKLTVPGLVECPQCHEMKMPHRVCPECGYYNGKQVIVKEQYSCSFKSPYLNGTGIFAFYWLVLK